MTERQILIADDHAIIRLGLKFILDSHFNVLNADEVDDCKSLFEFLALKYYSHLILDLQMQDGNSMNIFSQLHSQYPDLKILIYSMSPEEMFAKRLLRMGATGFLSKQSSEGEVLKALDLFLLGRNYASDKLLEELRKGQSSPGQEQNPFDELSEREMLVVNNLLLGKGVKEIAGQLNLKSTTVATYKARIFDKVGVNNLVELRNVAHLYHFNSW
ncbi:MAG: response regulator transcription factor [Chitinophagaceae bacterium]|nr:response regulator transcription factor [Chitinophagaceae bacterium]